MSRKREIFRIIDDHMVNSLAADEVKKYINNLLHAKGGSNGPKATNIKKQAKRAATARG
ncbi:hypothetical protein [Neobacillus sp. NPDC093127]|uniref:hypothetical protein n=1 Tax=Neobacillus sp. NPDC093127 TaxID=3364296 RepID=UPI0037F666DF